MKNKEKYANEIVELSITDGSAFAVDKNIGIPIKCGELLCGNCAFNKTGAICSELRKQWAEAEYKEPITAETVNDEFRTFCGRRKCKDCEYSSTRFVMDCAIRFVFDNYNVTEKGAEND